MDIMAVPKPISSVAPLRLPMREKEMGSKTVEANVLLFGVLNPAMSSEESCTFF